MSLFFRLLLLSYLSEAGFSVPAARVRTLAGLALRTPLSHGPGLDSVGSTFQRGNEVTPLLVAQVRNRWWQRQAALARLHTRVPSKRNVVYCDVKKEKKELEDGARSSFPSGLVQTPI